MAQPGIAGGSNAGGGSSGVAAATTTTTRLTSEPPPGGPQQLDDIKDVQGHQLNKAGRESGALQRARDDAVYGFPRPHGLASPANSLGTESLVTPTTTPEPSGSPRGTLDQPVGIEPCPPPLPSPVIQNTYDRYMPTPPMVMPQYMTTYAGYYSQPVYVVHSGAAIASSQTGFGLQPMHPMHAHAGHHYLPHPLEPVHHPVPYDFSVPPPNYTYMPMAAPPHPPPMLAAHPPTFNMPGPAMYKISDRFVPLEGAPAMGGMHHERIQPLPSGEILMEPVHCEQLDDGMQSQDASGDLRSSCGDDHELHHHHHHQQQQQQQFNQHHHAGQEDPDVTEVTEIIEEIHIFERPSGYQPNAGGEVTYVDDHLNAGTVTPCVSDDGCDRRSTKSWYDECTSHEQRAADNAEVKEGGGDGPNPSLAKQSASAVHKAEQPQHCPYTAAAAAAEGKLSEPRRTVTPAGAAAAASADYTGNVNSHYNHVRQNSHGDSHLGVRDGGEGYQHRRRDQRDGRRVDSRDSTRERSGGRFDNHGRRSLTPEKRYNRNHQNFGGGAGGGGQREDRRYSNPEHGAAHLRARRPRVGGYEQAPSRESSTGRRDNNANNNNNNHNRQRYYPSPKRDGHDGHRYDENHHHHSGGGGRRFDGGLRRGGSGTYRQQWRDDSLPSIPRGGNTNAATNNNNSRKPPLPRQDNSSSSSGSHTHAVAGPEHTANGLTYPILNGNISVKDSPAFGVGSSQQQQQRYDNKKPKNRSDDDPSFLEFLGPSLLGINDRLDVKVMMSRSQQQAVSMDSSSSSSDDGDHNRDHPNGNASSNINSSKHDLGSKRDGHAGHANLRQTRKDHHHE